MSAHKHFYDETRNATKASRYYKMANEAKKRGDFHSATEFYKLANMHKNL